MPETMNERIAATDHAESKCNMCRGKESLPLEHYCGRLKGAFSAGAAWQRRYDVELQLQMARELKAEREQKEQSGGDDDAKS